MTVFEKNDLPRIEQFIQMLAEPTKLEVQRNLAAFRKRLNDDPAFKSKYEAMDELGRFACWNCHVLGVSVVIHQGRE